MSSDPRKGKLHHIGIIVPDEKRVDVLLALFGHERGHSVYADPYKALCVFSKGEGTVIEFLIPDKDSVLASFNNGLGGLHHIAFEVEKLSDTMKTLDADGIDFLENEPVPVGDLAINFLEPLVTRGFITEYVEKISS